jgi:hypothetical protein
VGRDKNQLHGSADKGGSHHHECSHFLSNGCVELRMNPASGEKKEKLKEK